MGVQFSMRMLYACVLCLFGLYLGWEHVVCLSVVSTCRQMCITGATSMQVVPYGGDLLVRQNEHDIHVLVLMQRYLHIFCTNNNFALSLKQLHQIFGNDGKHGFVLRVLDSRLFCAR